MNRSFIIDTEAEADLARAKKWYDDRRDGLGKEFIEEVEVAFQTIQRIPLVSRLIFKDLRRTLLRRFPYSAFYRVTSDLITVVAVYHTSRDPRGWQDRA